MSPIPSVATAFALSTPTPLVALDPDSAMQPALPMSQHLLRTGGLLFAVVAIVSVAGYFYQGRGAASSSRTNNSWVSLSGLWSSIRYLGSATTSTVAAKDWRVDLEAGFKDVSMVYTRFFHPTFWNLVECHPAMPSAPAIYVEEEADETPTSGPKPPGRNSFLNMDDGDDDDDVDGNKDNITKDEKPDPVSRSKELPPYDMSSPTNVNFTSEIIGTTIRLGGFLSLPGEPEEDPSESSPSDCEVDFPCSPYDGIAGTDSEFDFRCSPYGGIAPTSSELYFRCSPYDGAVPTSSELDFHFSPYDGIVTPPPRSPRTRTQRYGMADMASFAESLRNAIAEEGYGLRPTVSPPTGLLDLSRLSETDPTLSCEPSHPIDLYGDELTVLNCDLGVHDSHDSSGNGPTDTDTVATPVSHEGLDIMRKLLAELRDPDMDCNPWPLSEESDSEYYGDDEGEEASAPSLTSSYRFHNASRDSFESICSPGPDSEVSDEGLIYPFTPPSKSAMSFAIAPHVLKDRIPLPVLATFDKELAIVSPTFPDSPLMFPTKAHVRSHRDSRSLLYGPRVPLVDLPRL